MIEKVISGGQTGIDRMGLEVAKSLGITTGGLAPLGYRTENGPDLSLAEYGLSESEFYDYAPRTGDNIRASDGTVIFGDTSSPGSRYTIKVCKAESKPYLVNPPAAELRLFIAYYQIKTLNVAGNRMSKLSQQELDKYKDTLTKSLS